MAFQVAIDGPSASGKSSIAKQVAKQFNLVHINTGLMYRAMAFYALQQNISLNDEEGLVELIETADLKLTTEQLVILNGEDVSEQLKNVSLEASAVSRHPKVRNLLVQMQQKMAAATDCVMDGRDIGTVVLPNADVKIFITADVKERARRRYVELINLGQNVIFDDIFEDMINRDDQDINRPVGPLKQAEDAIMVDTTGNSFAQSVSAVIEIVSQKCEKEESYD